MTQAERRSLDPFTDLASPAGADETRDPAQVDRAALDDFSTRGTKPVQKQLSILLVEDEGITGQDLKECLNRLGYRVVGWALDGPEAVGLAEERRPDLILMDVGLPGEMDGIQAARVIQQRAHLPIVFLTGHRDMDTLQRAVNTGPMGYLVKPFEEVELRCAIEVAIHKHHAEVALREREEALRKNAEILHSLSLIDELTALKNRRGFFALAHQELKAARRANYCIAFFFLDLNGLKQINDRFGHSIGDQALRDASKVIAETFRESDIIARLGGDEFVALARVTGEEGVPCIRLRLDEHLRAFRARHERPYELNMSMGAAVAQPHTEEDVETLLVRADTAMYTEKRRHAQADKS
jgi:diguanylate cyclase (GGDEF)-like protein